MVDFRRTLLPFVVLAACSVAIVVRLFFIQIWHNEDLEPSVAKMTRRERAVIPCRGMIRDREGKILAMSTKSYTLFVDPRVANDPAGIEKGLRKAGIEASARAIAGAKDTAYLVIARGLDASMMQKINDLRLKGVGFEQGYRRQYPEGRMASHVLGVVGKDGYGLEGIEIRANGYLSGEKVTALKYRDGGGREIYERLLDREELRGADVYLTIDAGLQFIAEQEIDRAVKESGSRRGTVIIQDPLSGEILAMASKPDFDPADFAGAKVSLKNPALSDVFEPGSTFKLVTVAAALQTNAARTGEAIWCEEGKYTVFGHTISDHDKKGFLTLNGIMEYSSNIGVAKLGQRLGKERLYQFIRQFGFYGISGIDLPGEARGLLKEPGKWSGLSVPVISFGQEIGVTALQMVNAYSAIANGGYLLEPRIVREVRSAKDETPAGSVRRRVIRQVVSANVAAEMKEMLRSVVEHGTGQMAKVPGYSVGGKTGTAQKRDSKTGRYSSSCYVASFCGIIPMSAPKLTIFVVLDEPRGDYWASSRAAPVFSRIAARSVHHCKISPDLEPSGLAAKKRGGGTARARPANTSTIRM